MPSPPRRRFLQRIRVITITGYQSQEKKRHFAIGVSSGEEGGRLSIPFEANLRLIQITSGKDRHIVLQALTTLIDTITTSYPGSKETQRMDELAQISGRGLDDVLDPTIAVLSPLLKKNSSAIKEIPLKTFQYGPTDRHQLDVYYPLTAHSSGKTPILFFIYGGSFTTGARNLNTKFGLVYANLGAFFARQGITTVIPDYRLVPDVAYPQPVEDIRDAMNWVVHNPNALTPEAANEAGESLGGGMGSLQLDKLFILGHSAGAFHVASLLFNPDILPLHNNSSNSTLRSRIAGGALSGGPYDLSAVQAGNPRGDLYQTYFGSIETAKQNDILALVNRFPTPSESIGNELPDVLLIKAEEEPPFLNEASEELKKTLEKKFGRDQKMIVGKGHNHISINWALGIGEGEEWAYELADWIWGRVREG